MAAITDVGTFAAELQNDSPVLSIGLPDQDMQSG